jgi:DNA-binding PadR family transcriptional regulator
MNTLSKELMAATSTSIILSILRDGETYGYELIQQAENITDGHVQYKEGTLYPILKKMEQQGWIESENKMHNGRRRKYYSLTHEGQKTLDDNVDQWLIVVGILKKLWARKDQY